MASIHQLILKSSNPMGSINLGRVIVGGLLAGVIILIGEAILNLSLLGEEWQTWSDAHNLPAPDNLTSILYILMDFLVGITLVLIYALIRPRCGAGPTTALFSGFLVWFLLWLLGLGSMGIAFAMPGWIIVAALLWGLVEVLLASLAGGWLYREGAEPEWSGS
jgi:hypothetical protein